MKLDQIITTRLSLAVRPIDDFRWDKEVLGEVRVSLPELKLKAIENPVGYHNFFDLKEGLYRKMKIESDYYLREEIENFSLPRNILYLLAVGLQLPRGSLEAELSDIDGLRTGDVLEFNNWSDPPEKRTVTLDSDPATNKVHWDQDPQGGLLYDYDDSTASVVIPSPENLVLPVRLIPRNAYPFPAGTTLLRGTVRDVVGNPVPDATVERVGSTLSTRTALNGDFVLYFSPLQGDAPIQIKVTRVTDTGSQTITGDANLRKGSATSIQVTFT